MWSIKYIHVIGIRDYGNIFKIYVKTRNLLLHNIRLYTSFIFKEFDFLKVILYRVLFKYVCNSFHIKYTVHFIHIKDCLHQYLIKNNKYLTIKQIIPGVLASTMVTFRHTVTHTNIQPLQSTLHISSSLRTHNENNNDTNPSYWV